MKIIAIITYNSQYQYNTYTVQISTAGEMKNDIKAYGSRESACPCLRSPRNLCECQKGRIGGYGVVQTFLVKLAGVTITRRRRRLIRQV